MDSLLFIAAETSIITNTRRPNKVYISEPSDFPCVVHKEKKVPLVTG